MTKKPWYKSKTIIIAILQGILGILVAFATQYPEIGGLLIAKSALDMVIRWYTTQPID